MRRWPAPRPSPLSGQGSGGQPSRSPNGCRWASGPRPSSTPGGGSGLTRSGANSLSARSPSEETYEVAIVGAGDVGCAIARELARFDLRIALIEAGPDVGAGTSKANTAILHTGFDARPGTLEARLVARGHDLLMAYADEVGIPIERTGALLVAWEDEHLARFAAIRENAERCGYRAVREVGADQLYRREPHLG